MARRVVRAFHSPGLSACCRSAIRASMPPSAANPGESYGGRHGYMWEITMATPTPTRPVYDMPCGDQVDRYGTAQRFGPYGPCVLPLGHPGLHAVEHGEQWGRADRSTWGHEPRVPDEWGSDSDDESVDFDVATVSDHV